jgi:hypothetical protein
LIQKEEGRRKREEGRGPREAGNEETRQSL